MGVPGLFGLVKSRYTQERVEFVPDDYCSIAIDCIGFAFHLYRLSGLDWKHGGELRSFADYSHNYVERLSLSGDLQIHVFVDSLFHVDDRKRETTLKRRRDQMSTMDEEFVLPLLAVQTMLDAIRPLCTIHHNSTAEADTMIASFVKAQRGRCIVLSNDSDFFLFSDVKEFCDFQGIDLIENGVVLRVFCTENAMRAVGVSSASQVILSSFACLAGNDHSPSSGLIDKWCDKLKIPSHKRLNHIVRHLSSCEMGSGSPEEFLKKLCFQLAPGDAQTFKCFMDTYLWYSLSDAQETNNHHVTYWWPRPVIEYFDKSIFCILGPLRYLLVQNKMLKYEHECGPGKKACYETETRILDATFSEAVLAELREKLQSGSYVEVAQVCLNYCEIDVDLELVLKVNALSDYETFVSGFNLLQATVQTLQLADCYTEDKAFLFNASELFMQAG